MKHVLVVEDDCDVREILITVLEDSGYAVLGARHGREALALLADPDHVAVLLLDMRMPVMDGWQLAGTLRAQPSYAALPIIVITAAIDVAAVAAQIGAQGYLAKPFTIQGIKDVVAAFLHPPPL